jgi:group I intron endonuclease
MGYIYIIRHKVSGKAYIGQTIRPIEKRLAEHQLSSNGCKAICGAIQKYGWENFDAEWYEIPDADLNFYEEMLVALLGTLTPGGYNLKEGGGAHGKPSDETKQKMSKAKTGEKCYMYGKKHSDETKQKMSEAQSGEKHPNYGNTLTEETKKKLSKALSGKNHRMYEKTLGTEHKKKISEALSGEKNPNSKNVYQYNLNGTFVNKFGSSGEAARTLGKSRSPIIRCAGGDRKSAHGFKWSYTEL